MQSMSKEAQGRGSMKCRKCGIVINSNGDLCEKCQRDAKEQAEYLKKYLDNQISLSDITTELPKKEKKKMGCLIMAGIIFPPIWLGLLIYHFRSSIFPLVSNVSKSINTESNSKSSEVKPRVVDEAEQSKTNFGFYGGDGNYYEAGGVFCDWAGNYVEWGKPFTDSKGNLVEWGGCFYDSKGYYCEWGGPFYDSKGYYIVPR